MTKAAPVCNFSFMPPCIADQSCVVRVCHDLAGRDHREGFGRVLSHRVLTPIGAERLVEAIGDIVDEIFRRVASGVAQEPICRSTRASAARMFPISATSIPVIF